MLANLENSAVATGLERSFSLKKKKKRQGHFHCNPKERQFQRMFNYHTVALISPGTKVISSSKSLTVHEL